MEQVCMLAEFACRDLALYFICLMDELGLEISRDLNTLDNALYSKEFIALHHVIMGREEDLIRPETQKQEQELLIKWSKQLEHSVFERMMVNSIISRDPIRWKEPALLSLPRSYDELFSLFFGSVCRACNETPNNPMICLVCGELSCLDRCCTTVVSGLLGLIEPDNEVERHAQKCSGGAGTGCFLSLQTSVVVVSRQSQVIIWGSVYLDAHGEEDRNLKRGKPLFLSEQRLERLSKEWLEQKFAVRGGGLLNSWFPLTQLQAVLKELYYYT